MIRTNWNTFKANFDWSQGLLIGIVLYIAFSFWNDEIGDLDVAFLDLDKGLNHSMEVINNQNIKTLHQIDSFAYISNHPRIISALDSAIVATKLTNMLCDYIQNIKNELIIKSGGYNQNKIPLNFRDNTNAYNYFSTSNKIKELSDLVEYTRSRLIFQLDENNRENYLDRIFLPTKKLSDTELFKTNFKNASLAMTLATLSKLQLDAKSSEIYSLNYFAEKTSFNKFCCICDIFRVSLMPQVTSVEGEPFKVKLMFPSYPNDYYEKIIAKINGKKFIGKEGVFHFIEKTESLGTKNVNVEVDMYQYDFRKKIYYFDKKLKETFTYEVVAPMLDLSHKNARNLYQNIEHQFSIKMANEAFENLEISSKDLIIKKLDNGTFTVKAQKTGKATFRVDGKQFGQNFIFNVKPIPTALAKLGGKILEGSLSPNEFQNYQYLSAIIPDFDFETKCKIESFTFHYLPKGEDEISIENQGSTFSNEIKGLQLKAKSGDIYYFTDIKANYLNEEKRELNTLVFKIK